MLELSKLSARYRVRSMKESDADEILALCRGNELFYRYSGKQLSRELILRDLRVTPPNTPPEAKYYVGFCDGEVLAAVMDLVEGYPDGDTAFIGFFMMNRQLQGRQIGSGILQEVLSYLKQRGLKRILLGIDKENPQSNHFWAKNGFSVIREEERPEGPILLAEKRL